MSLPEHRQRQTFTQPGPDGHQARHGADRVHVLRPVPRHDQVSDLLCQRHPQRSAGVLQEDRREGTASRNHVDVDLNSPHIATLSLRLVTWLIHYIDQDAISISQDSVYLVFFPLSYISYELCKYS